ncbi:MAG: lysylphosphatidylglycerol synthase domain-containing protein, partial [Pseudonocardiaceae bacterium]
KWLGFVSALHLGIGRIRHRPSEALSVLVTAVAYQMAIVCASWAGANAIGIQVSWWAVMAFVPVAALAQVLPLSLNGIGLREGAFVLLLAPLGVAAGQAVAFGLLLYGINLVTSLLGAPAFAMGARPAPSVSVAA